MTSSPQPDAPLQPSAADLLTNFNNHTNTLRDSINAASNLSDITLLKQSLEEARQLLSEGVEWWVSYEIRRTGEIITELEQLLDNATERVKPRRRFRFKKRDEGDDAANQANVIKVREETQVATDGNSPEIADKREADKVRQSNVLTLDATNVTNGTLAIPESCAGKDISVRDISSAHITFPYTMPALRIQNLRDCHVDTCMVQGSVHVTGCTGCTFVTTAGQLRIHDTKNCVFRVFMKSGPIIEGCSGLRFEERTTAGVVWERNAWREVQDFSWLREGESPNWSVPSPLLKKT